MRSLAVFPVSLASFYCTDGSRIFSFYHSNLVDSQKNHVCTRNGARTALSDPESVAKLRGHDDDPRSVWRRFATSKLDYELPAYAKPPLVFLGGFVVGQLRPGWHAIAL